MIYADNASTTQVSPEVACVVSDYMTYWFGNPSSNHAAGRRAKDVINKAEISVRRYFNAWGYGLVFTSGATEADNMAINFAVKAGMKSGRRHMVISAFEHPAVYEACMAAKKAGFTITEVNPNSSGVINPGDVAEAIRNDTICVSIMAVNNELGTQQPIDEIGRVCRERGVYFHTDATQALTQHGFDLKRQCVDMVSCTAHKIYGPKGIGLFLFNGLIDGMQPMMYGGHQQYGLRPGTENVPGIAGFGVALDDLRNGVWADNAIAAKRSFLEEIKAWDRKYSFNAETDKTNSGIISLRVHGVKGQDLALLLGVTKDICVSAGSACASGSNAPSKSLKAIGLSDREALETIRISFGRFNAAHDGYMVAKSIKDVVSRMLG